MQCRYVNHTSQFQIIRIENTTSPLLERTVFPHAKVLFEAELGDYLEVHTGNPVSSILSDNIPCHRLADGADHSFF